MLCTSIINFSLYICSVRAKGATIKKLMYTGTYTVCTCILLQSSGLVTIDINLSKSLQPNSYTWYATYFVCSQGCLEDYFFLFLKKGVLQMMQTRINSLKASVERYLLLIKLNKNTKVIILIKNNLRGTLYLVLLDKQNRKSCIYTCGVQ